LILYNNKNGDELTKEDFFMFCTKCGSQIDDRAAICVHCGCEVDKKDPDDKSSAGIAVLTFFFPIVGLILWLVWKDTKPLAAKSAGKGALIGVIVNVVLSVLLTACSFIFTFMAVENAVAYEMSLML
jgi:uncharacterized protein (DUF983 family)